MARILIVLQGFIFKESAKIMVMKTYKNLWDKLCTFENLEQAYELAKKHKSGNPKVIEFGKHWRLHLCILLKELRTQTYNPQPLRKFVLRDPKTRTICVSEFRDRVIHHALVNILKPIFEQRFIHDSYASRIRKGTLPALERFDRFKRQVTENGKFVSDSRNKNWVKGFVLKADIKHYFETVEHSVLIGIFEKRIKDEKMIWLIKSILGNYTSGIPGVGMPLGNWTSQFFANVYLNELDQFVKHKLRLKYYIRYVDDFVILHKSKRKLKYYKQKIDAFLQDNLKLQLHSAKSKIIPLGRGTNFLGFRIFYHYKIVRKKNLRKIKAKLSNLIEEYRECHRSAHDIFEALKGWKAYALQGNMYKLCQKLEEQIKKELKN